MLHYSLERYAEEHPEKILFYSDKKFWSAGELLDEANLLAGILTTKGWNSVSVYIKDQPLLIVLLAALEKAGVDTIVMNRSFSLARLVELAHEYNNDAIISDINEDCSHITLANVGDIFFYNKELNVVSVKNEGYHSRCPSICLLTSGTTGTPKLVKYNWSTLFEHIKSKGNVYEASQRWLLAYKLNHYAGIQMMLYVLSVRCSLIFGDSDDVSDLWRVAKKYEATHVSSTPTFWRTLQLMKRSHIAFPSLSHITLGSEPVTDRILESIRDIFPGASISHIYATTELGSIVSVKDGRAGLPLELFLECGEEKKALFRIQNGELCVRRRTENQPEWISTSDLVEVVGDRVHFVGRSSLVINVGGVKVYPQKVEECALKVEGVVLARAMGQPNPLTGEIVRLDVVLDDGVEQIDVEELIIKSCSNLGRHATPRLLNFVPALETNNFKLCRV